MLGMSQEVNQLSAFWIAEVVSKLCPERETLARSWRKRNEKSTRYVCQIRPQDRIAILSFRVVFSRAGHDTPCSFSDTSLLIAVMGAEVPIERCVPIVFHSLRSKTSNLLFKKNPFFSEFVDHQSFTLQAHKSTARGTLAFEPVTTATSSPSASTSPQQRSQVTVSTFSPQKSSSSSKAQPAPTTSGDGVLLFSSPSHQYHSALSLPFCRGQFRLFFRNDSYLTTTMKTGCLLS